MEMGQMIGLGVAVALLLFALISWPIAHYKLQDEPTFVIALSELALIYTAIDSITNILLTPPS